MSSLDFPWTVEQRLACGGSSNVYKGLWGQSAKSVAIKCLHPGEVQTIAEKESCKNILHKLSSLNSNNVVPILASDVDADPPWLVMEYLEGEDLASRLIQTHALTMDEALPLFIQMAQGLSDLHQGDLLHQDLKPDNIFLCDSQKQVRVVLIDAAMTTLASENQPADQFGPPEYWSPEQATAQKVDRRSDIYSLGIVFFESLTGSTPFRSHSYSDVIASHLHRDPGPLHTPAGFAPIVPSLQQVIRKCMARSPEKRFQSAQELIGALEKIQAELSEDPPVQQEPPHIHITATPTASAASTKWLFAVSILFFITLFTAGYYTLRPDGLRSEKLQTTPAVDRNLTHIAVEITSDPAGAAVYQKGGGNIMGQTPFVLNLAHSKKPMVLLFRFRDGRTVELPFAPDRSTTLHVDAQSAKPL